MKIYWFTSDDSSPTGAQHFTSLKKACSEAQSLADWEGDDITVYRSTVAKMSKRDLVVALLNHEGWSDNPCDKEWIVKSKKHGRAEEE